MKWEEVRKLYPDQLVKVEILDSYIKYDKEIISDVAVIGTVKESEATKELLDSKDNVLVYHTSKEGIYLKIRNRIGLRRVK